MDNIIVYKDVTELIPDSITRYAFFAKDKKADFKFVKDHELASRVVIPREEIVRDVYRLYSGGKIYKIVIENDLLNNVWKDFKKTIEKDKEEYIDLAKRYHSLIDRYIKLKSNWLVKLLLKLKLIKE